MNPQLTRIGKNGVLFILSLSLAWWLIKNGLLHNLVVAILPVRFLAEILAGIFYTSFLTTPLSLAMLLVLSETNNPILTAALAGVGAVLGDLLIVKFIREKIKKDVTVISRQLQLEKINKTLKALNLEFMTPLIGALIIASPFPDELGLLLLGVSQIKYFELVILTYVLNTAGILLILVPINLIV